MSTTISRLLGTPIRWQIATLVLVTQIAAHAITMPVIVGLLGVEGRDRATFASDSVGSFTTVLRMLSQTDPAWQAKLVEATLTGDTAFRVTLTPPRSLGTPTSELEGAFQRDLERRVPPEWRKRIVAYVGDAPDSIFPAEQSVGAAAMIAGGKWLVYQPVEKSLWQLFPTVLVTLAIIVLAAPLSFLAIWSGSALVAPIRALATGAEQFSKNLNANPLPERGALEIRKATRALNAMQIRLRKLVDARTQALAAIGHDMRTPLTRLRLKSEAIDNDELRETITEELSGLDRMIDLALSYLRSQHETIAPRPVNITALARTVADELTDQGKEAHFEGSGRLVFDCDPDLVRRALENLTNNAVTYGGSATIRVHLTEAQELVLEVADTGPGIPEDERSAAQEPFKKLSKERPQDIAQNKGGFGLGLSITKNIAEAHGGTLTLKANEPSGLIATITIPAPDATRVHTKGGAHVSS